MSFSRSNDQLAEVHELRDEFRAVMRQARAEQDAAQVLQQIWFGEFDRLSAWVRANAPEHLPALRAHLAGLTARVRLARSLSGDGPAQ